jgi:predicted AAA+ superfamily ATPase
MKGTVESLSVASEFCRDVADFFARQHPTHYRVEIVT